MSFETGEWSLAKDKEFIDKLEKRSAEFLRPLSEIPNNLDQLATETAQLNLLFQNVIGDLNTLSEKRFIENRVAEAHDEKPPLTPEPEVKPATDEQLREAVRTGLKAFGLLPVEELNDDDDRETGYECFARDRPFSLIIGSKQWLEADPFEGIAPVDTSPVAGTPISEAMEDLVLPSTSTVGYDVEEATEAEVWHQKERASTSTQGETRPLDSDSESSVISNAPRKTTVPPLLTDLTGPNKPRGLFDEESDDDGDLFGVSRKPSTSSVNHRGSRSSVSQPTQPPESVASLQQEAVSNEAKSTPGPVSFLDELKKKTGQRNSSGQQDVKSPPTPTPTSKPQQQTQRPTEQRRDSIFDSDPESDIFVPKPKPPVTLSNSRSRSGTSLLDTESRQVSHDPQRSETSVSNARSKKSPLLDTDSEEEAFPKDVRKQSLPKISSPLGSSTTQILPKLPKKNSLFDDSDSDSDIFGPPKKTTQKVAEKPQQSEPILEAEEAAQVVKPKEFKGVRVLPQIPVKAKDKEVAKAAKAPTPKVDSSAPESKRSQAPFTSLESVVKPRSSESEDEGVKPGKKLPATRPQLLPAKLPNLFCDSDSDDDLFGASPVNQKSAAVKKSDVKPKTTEKQAEVPFKSKLSEDSKNRSSIKESEQSPNPKPPPDSSLVPRPLERIPREAADVDPLAPKKSEIAQEPPPAEPSQTSKPEDKPLAKKSNIFSSSNSDSDEDLLRNSSILPPLPLAPDKKSQPLIDDSVVVKGEVVESLTAKSSEAPPPVEEQEPLKTMAEKTSSVKKIGMGLPAGLLQGLKARQQQLGIAQPEPKRNETPAESKTQDAPPPMLPKSSGDSGIVAMKSDHKDIVEIAKRRVKGPSGRRLPTRSAGAKKSEVVRSEPQVVESAQIKSDDVETKQSIPEEPLSEHPADVIRQTLPEKAEPVTQPPPPTQPKQEAVQNPLSLNAAQTDKPTPAANTVDSMDSADAPQQSPASEIREEQGEKEAKPSRSKTKSIFASDSSDEDLFAPKAPPRRKSLPKESAVESRPVARSSIPVGNDPLSAAPSTTIEETADEPKQPVAPKRAAKTTPQTDKVETPKTTSTLATKPTPSKSLFSDSDDDDDDGLLFGSKKTKTLPKSATTSSLSSAKDKPKLTQSKSVSTNLFGSDSDSDELFKKK